MLKNTPPPPHTFNTKAGKTCTTWHIHAAVTAIVLHLQQEQRWRGAEREVTVRKYISYAYDYINTKALSGNYTKEEEYYQR